MSFFQPTAVYPASDDDYKPDPSSLDQNGLTPAYGFVQQHSSASFTGPTPNEQENDHQETLGRCEFSYFLLNLANFFYRPPSWISTYTWQSFRSRARSTLQKKCKPRNPIGYEKASSCRTVSKQNGESCENIFP